MSTKDFNFDVAVDRRLVSMQEDGGLTIMEEGHDETWLYSDTLVEIEE